MSLKAEALPFSDSDTDFDVLIEIYVVTGKHVLFNIPDSFCKECNLFYHAAKEASENTEKDVEIRVKSYWTRFLRPLLKGGYHPPVLLVNGKIYSQGYNVPEVESLSREITES